MATSTTAVRLARIWESPAGIIPWITTVDHKAVGRRYIYTAFGFFLAAGLLAVQMRAQLAVPQNAYMDAETYNQFFTVHGVTMIFFFATPIQFGIGNFVVPLMIGARDMAFPRLNAFGYWVFLFAGLLLYSSFLIGAAPDTGWFSYVPNSGPKYTPGLNNDFYALSLLFLAISTTAGAINFIVTIFKMRAPGMSINRMPMFLWSILATSFAVPSLSADNLMMEIDRKLGGNFFDPTRGGSALLWQHVFWVFGHPDVYIIFLPAIGMVSTIVPVFARRPLVGYIYVALATVTTGIIAFGVWVHHMFTVGLPGLSYGFFSAASMLITIPSGIQFFAWIATMWKGKVVWKSPFLFAAGFFFLMLIGGMTGVMFAAVPFDQAVHNTYFVVAHFHYVLFGGAVFPIFAGLHYWFPKFTGRMLNETMAKTTFWVMFLGMNLLYFPMHIVGMLGMPRRIYTYPESMGWAPYNMAESIGGYILAFGILLFMINVLRSLAAGEKAPDNPWGADTLEWGTSSPPPAYNFVTIPTVASRNPIWDQHEEASDIRLDNRRVTLGTTVLDSVPEGLVQIPEESWIPLILALALTLLFIGFLLSAPILWGLGIAATTLSIAAWNWPTQVATP